MIADIELFADATEIVSSAAETQRTLLTQVRNHDADPATASESAAELLRWYVRFGHMDAPEVQEAVEEGIEAVMLQVARASMEVKSRTDVTPLDFFPFPRKSAKGGPKKAGVKKKLLALRAAHGDYLTEADMRGVLTTLPGADGKRRTVPRDKWPSTLDSIEDAMTDYLGGAYKDVPAEQRRAFVRESFPSIPWGKKGRVVYPSHWLTCAS